jgi:uncharacterized protein with PQ loop repeat
MCILLNSLGVLATLILGFSSVPQVILIIKQGHARGISLASVLLQILGFVLLCIYVYIKHGWDLWLHGEYLIALMMACTILRYKIYE